MSGLDPGLQPERTRLAWQRTTLTGLAALLVALRLLVQISPILGAAATLTAALALAVPVWSATRWQLAHPSLTDAKRSDGRAPAVLATIVTICCLAALVYALLR